MTGHTEAVAGSDHTVSHGKGAQGFQLSNNGWNSF